MKTVMSIVAVVSMICGICGCQRVSEVLHPAPADREGETLEIGIGVVLPLTGHLATVGKVMKQGMDLAVDEINTGTLRHGRLKFIIADDTSTAAGAVSAFNHLIDEEGVSVILGPASSSATAAAFPIAGENRVVAISPTSGAQGLSEISEYVFRIPLSTEVVVPRGVEVTHAKLGYQRVATLTDETDLFSTDRETALRETFRAKGIEVLRAEVFKSGDTDFQAQLKRIKAFSPDAIFVSALPPEKPGILIQAHQAGITAPVLMSSLTNVEVQAAGVAAEGAITFISWFSEDSTPGNQAFVANYTTAFGKIPDGFAAASYTAVYILAVALENTESTDSDAIRDALVGIHALDTIFGSFRFNAEGDAVYPSKVLIVKDGRLQLFE